MNLPSSPNPRCTSHPRQSSSNLTTPPSRSQTPQSFVFSPNSINNLQHINPQKKPQATPHPEQAASSRPSSTAKPVTTLPTKLRLPPKQTHTHTHKENQKEKRKQQQQQQQQQQKKQKEISLL